MGSSRLPLVLALLLVLAACGVGAWLALGRDSAIEPAVAGAPRDADSAPKPAAESSIQALPSELSEPGAGSERTSIAAEREQPEERAFPLEGASWVEVRIERPLGTPVDEDVEVLADSLLSGDEPPAPQSNSSGTFIFSMNSGDPAREYRARQDASGAFRVAFAAGAVSARLQLNAHYLYLPEALDVALPPSGPITLRPKLGGRLRARLQVPSSLPEDLKAENLTGAEIELSGWTQGDHHNARGVVGADLVADVGGLRPAMMYTLQIPLPHMVDVHEGPLTFGQGETVERSIDLVVGARLRGRVVDDSGAPVSGAEVMVQIMEDRNFFGSSGPERDRSGKDGSFDLRGIPPGKITLRAREDEHQSSDDRELELADGQVVDGLDLVLPRGNRLAGRVSFPDGRAAQGAQVTLDVQVTEGAGERQFTYSTPRNAQADAEGRFAIAGLGDGPFDVRAELNTVTDDAAGDVQMHRAEVWRAQADKASPLAELALVLEPPIAIRGKAVDDTGAPVTKFSVRAGDAARQDETPWRMVLPGSSGDEFESEDGSFELHTLGRGQWTVALVAEGHGGSEPQTITLPGDSGPFTFVLPRAARLAGRVLDPTGRAAPGAKVRMARSTGAQPWMNDASEHDADDEGRFAIEGVEPGAVELRAHVDGFAPSAALELEVRPAEPQEDLELALRVGGTLTGEVYRKDGTPDPNQQVMAQQPMGGDSNGTAQTDGTGRFTMEHLAPGRYQVICVPDMENAMARGDEDPVAMIEQLRMGAVEVRDNETVHIVLGAPPAAPVQLTGVVREAGRPMPELFVMALAEGSSMLSNLKSARTAADGTFAIQLPAAGDWILLVGEGMNGEGNEFSIEVPEAETHAVELDLPTGRVSGRVVTPDGSPAGSVQVSLSGGRGMTLFNMSGGREVQTEQDGSFSFERVRAGEYDLRAGSDAQMYFGGSSPNYGVALLPKITVEEGGALDGLELRLREPGTIVGRVVKADGSPAARATVWIRDASGRVLNPRSWCVTDGSGRFSFPGASEGRHAVLARTELAATNEVAIDVHPGAENEVELRLQEGTILLVAVEDEQGKALRAQLRVYDENEREVSGLGSMQDVERAMTEGFSTREQKIGPLPPGRYRVEGTAQDGARAAKPVTLNGQPERRLRLRLKE